ncbi:hypothetical protein SRHO_G00260120 [Serrasalmus rhombeus]
MHSSSVRGGNAPEDGLPTAIHTEEENEEAVEVKNKLLVVLTLISDPFSERMRAECDAAQLSDDPRLLEPDHSSTKRMMFSLKSSPALSYQV